ncbi:MAG TPA: DUF4304 domain-containing protein [Myxococcaceae bacterium]|nr:DUF4304 domain-containing protein [Myxococcaceae bacterium]
MNRTLRELGFTGSANTWRKPLPDSLLVINLQKSQYGPQFYLNLGVWLKQLGDVNAPKEHQCHVRLRATALADDKGVRLGQALDLENSTLSQEQRENFIAGFIQQEVLPFMETVGTVQGLGAAITCGKLDKAMVHKQVKDLLFKNE